MASWGNQGEDQSQKCPKERRAADSRVIAHSVAWGPVRSPIRPTSYDRELAWNADALVITECCEKECLCFLRAWKLALWAWFFPSECKSEVDEILFLITFHLDIPFLLDPFSKPHTSCYISGVLTAVSLTMHVGKRQIQTVNLKYKWATGTSKWPFQKFISWEMGLCRPPPLLPGLCFASLCG